MVPLRPSPSLAPLVRCRSSAQLDPYYRFFPWAGTVVSFTENHELSVMIENALTQAGGQWNTGP